MNTFTVGNLFRDAWKDYKKYWRIILLVMVVMAIVVSFGQVGADYNPYTEAYVQDGFASIISSLAITWLGIGYINFMLNIVDGKQARFKDIFYGVKSVEQFAYYVLVNLIYGAIVMLGLVFLIIPGIVLGIGLMFSKYYIAENRLGFADAFKSSWEITKGNRWKMLWLGIVLGFFNIFGALVLGVGLLITIPVSQLIYTRLFRQLDGIPVPEGGSDVEPEHSVEDMVNGLVQEDTESLG